MRARKHLPEYRRKPVTEDYFSAGVAVSLAAGGATSLAGGVAEASVVGAFASSAGVGDGSASVGVGSGVDVGVMPDLIC